MTTGVAGQFLLDSKNALEILKTRVAVATRIYSQNVEDKIRAHKDYPKLLALRATKSADRKETAKLVKKLLSEKLKEEGMTEEDFSGMIEELKANYPPYQILVQAEDVAFKRLKPQLSAIPVYVWMQEVRGLGLRFAVKLISKIRMIERFENPSKLRTYCGTAPGMKKVSGQEANFNPELKGILLGQVTESFIKSKSQYKRVYDEKKAYYLKLHPETLTIPFDKQVAQLEERLHRKLRKGEPKELTWTKSKIHNFAKKTMINRFIVDFWMAWYMSEGKVPPKNPWIADQPHHSLEPMIVPFTEEMKQKTEEIRSRDIAVPYLPKPKKESSLPLKVKKLKKKGMKS